MVTIGETECITTASSTSQIKCEIGKIEANRKFIHTLA